MRIIEEPYLTPPGYLDFPFAYVFDATGITDGLAQLQNLTKTLQGDSDFILRRIVGLDNVVDSKANGGKFNFHNASGSYAIGGQTTGVYRHSNWVVLPEKLYPKNSQIVFDLYQTLRNKSSCNGIAIYNSYIAFMGVKRFPVNYGYRSQTTPYKYKEKKYAYSYSLTLTQPFQPSLGVSAPVVLRQSQLIDNYDFELQRIAISYANTPGNTGGLLTDDFLITLYDANGHQTSDMPLNQSYINAALPSFTTSRKYQGIWPVPSLVYPAGAAIQFDISSLLCFNQVPLSYNILLEGIWRLPC